MIKIKVASKENLLHLIVSDSVDKNNCIISIQDPKNFIKFNTKIKILYLKFHDVEEDAHGYKTISKNDANAIANFVLQNKDKNFIISCEAGISRSSGVAGAISKFINDDDTLFFKYPFLPNMRCYRYVYAALLRNQSRYYNGEK